jgi:hypothetical protein
MAIVSSLPSGFYVGFPAFIGNEEQEPPHPLGQATDKRLIDRRGRYLDGLMRQKAGLRNSGADG